MINPLLDFVAPHHCYGCDKTGIILCDNCKNNIKDHHFSRCLQCLKPSGVAGVCRSHRLAYSQVWCLGERHDTLERLIDAYKFGRNKDAAVELGGLLACRIAPLPSGTVIVPIPTIAPHIRQRGFDHTVLIAREIARQHGVVVTSLLTRRTKTAQRQASRTVRLKQAAEAFELQEMKIDPRQLYVIVDDVFTTGATINAATDLLKKAGARKIAVAVATRQTLDDQG